jgi:hypothetical protein
MYIGLGTLLLIIIIILLITRSELLVPAAVTVRAGTRSSLWGFDTVLLRPRRIAWFLSPSLRMDRSNRRDRGGSGNSGRSQKLMATAGSSRFF